jgi:phosphoribosylaminoimidazolecarboxamide formyltransferase / IMP cyclohydrolase
VAPRALLSVTDKTGLAEFGGGLARRGFELVSTGGTARALREAGLPVLDVEQVTGLPEMLDGRVKTLHPAIHGGLLGDLRRDEHREAMATAGISPISIVAVNLYRFEETVRGEHGLEDAVEAIDIGGPAMIRAAAKNWANVAVVVDPEDYAAVLESLETEGFPELRRRLAAKAFRHTAYYDSVIARYLTEAAGESAYAETFTVGFRRELPLRYGENPHQKGALYRDPLAAPGIASAEQVWGLEVGYNNVNDADGAWRLVWRLSPGACAITKHGNPCGVAATGDLAQSFRQARDADPISAFGGVVAFNLPVDRAAAEAMAERGNKLDVVIAPEFSEEALQVFRERKGWGQQVRLIQAPPLDPKAQGAAIRSVTGGALVQDADYDPQPEWRIVTKLEPTEEQMRAMRFLWSIVPYVNSNAIVVGVTDRLLGVGAGQMNRVQSVRLALEQAGEGARGASLASDAFFPFPDSIEAAAAAGVACVVQPGGSVKDAEVIERADELGLAMCFTGVRHFRH